MHENVENVVHENGDLIYFFLMRHSALVWLLGELQDIKDILLYANHSDQQLKGNTCVVIGHLIRAALTEGRGKLDQWVRTELDKGLYWTQLCVYYTAMDI